MEKKKRAKIECKFCNWWRYVWIGRRGKKSFGPYHAWGHMWNHVKTCHRIEWRRIVGRCAEIEQESIKYDSMV